MEHTIEYQNISNICGMRTKSTFKITIFEIFCSSVSAFAARYLEKLEYRRTLAPVLFRFAVPVLTAKHVDDVVSSLFLLLIEPHWLVWRVRTAFRSCVLSLSLALASSLSLLLFESAKQIACEIIYDSLSLFFSLTSTFACCSRPNEHSP
jgi:hypothetical protein